MRKKINVFMMTALVLLSGALYAGNFLGTQVDTDCEFTGNLSQSCSYQHGGVNYRVLNCIPNGSDCSFTEPTTPTQE